MTGENEKRQRVTKEIAEGWRQGLHCKDWEQVKENADCFSNHFSRQVKHESW